MRILIGLSIVQTLLLGLIGLRMLEIGTQVETVSATSLDVLAATSRNTQQTTGQRPMSVSAATQPANEIDLNALRQVIREEISASSQGSPRQQPSSIAVDPDFLQQVNQDVDSFIARGGADSTSMAALQLQIARLPKDERAKMLSKLTKAMNSGQIENTF